MKIEKNTKITVTVATAIAVALFVWHSACVFSDMQHDIMVVKEAVIPIQKMEQDIAIIKEKLSPHIISSSINH
jgi:hypothetical protein